MLQVLFYIVIAIFVIGAISGFFVRDALDD